MINTFNIIDQIFNGLILRRYLSYLKLLVIICVIWFGIFSHNITWSDADYYIWGTAPSMPTARGRLAAAGLNGKIYAIGGYTKYGVETFYRTVEEYDMATNTWSTTRYNLDTHILIYFR